jgi:sugar phosphate isomerase/epimerase
MGQRAPLVHLKDYDPAVDPQWVPGGNGVMDWGGILEACGESGVRFGVIELDAYAGAPLDAVRESYRYFHGRGLL